jgi:hypothetical protein
VTIRAASLFIAVDVARCQTPETPADERTNMVAVNRATIPIVRPYSIDALPRSKELLLATN